MNLKDYQLLQMHYFLFLLPILMDHVYLIESKEYLLNNYTLIILTISSVVLMNVPFRLFSLRISLRKYDYNIFKITNNSIFGSNNFLIWTRRIFTSYNFILILERNKEFVVFNLNFFSF